MFELQLDCDVPSLERALDSAVTESIKATVSEAIRPVECPEHGDDSAVDVDINYDGTEMRIKVDWCCTAGEAVVLAAIKSAFQD